MIPGYVNYTWIRESHTNLIKYSAKAIKNTNALVKCWRLSKSCRMSAIFLVYEINTPSGARVTIIPGSIPLGYVVPSLVNT